MVMRLLDTATFEMVSGEQSTFKEEGYAILSHRWVGREITFEQIQSLASQLRSAPVQPTAQLAKIRGACDRAREQGLQWMWIDSCCINKASTVEESESINSMFKWYRDAKLCITYLSDVRFSTGNPKGEVFRSVDGTTASVWFSRGWTLQELLAPKAMQFFDMDWQYMGTKAELADILAHITQIDVRYLTGEKHFGNACIASKMSWIASRTTARVEDLAYSMLGIFNVVMTPRYGEGMRAFMRLQQLLLSTLTDESLFAWKLPQYQPPQVFTVPAGWEADEWGLLAPTPSCFKDSNRLTTIGKPVPRVHGGFSMTQQGLQVPIFDPGKARTLGWLVCPLWILAPLVHWILTHKEGEQPCNSVYEEQ
ncbi:uncharacterized protein JN550_005904 [Neoarthrinium moseri]|uniref:uncharacterized protein n=1 Tax=Neoarthrinium moseri TaxID=1658444 RepID=UPI001FDCCDC9|nr:uncharacterized protein JN550_005904 [Neoarthrinium moseri]KAI1869274.1 hypothetical protein JN550_005904 [Neoarthrinium moseri]